MRESQYCINHHPDKAEARRRRASRGGKAGGRGRPLSELQETKMLLKGLAGRVLNKSVDRADAAVANQLLNSYIRCISVELHVREQVEVVGRLEALEEALKATTGNGGRRWGA
jgi:hypothetical protein